MKKFNYDLTDEEDIDRLFFDTAKIFGVIFVILLIWKGCELLYFDKVNNYTKELVLAADKKYENRKILGLSTDNITCSNVMDKKVNYKSCNIEFKHDHAYLDMKVNNFIFQYRYNCYGSKDDLKCDKIDKIKERIEAEDQSHK